MTANPPPRPALRRDADGAIVPTQPVADRSAGSAAESAGKGRKRKGGKAEGDVELVVTLPKGVRKQLRKKAEARGYTAEEAAAQLILAWLEG